MLVKVIVLLIVTGCASAGSLKVLCDRTVVSRNNHAEALGIDGGNKSVTTGRVLISQIDAGCTSKK